MRFRTRLLLTYTLLVFLLVVGLGIAFTWYTTRVFEDHARSTYRMLADRMADQLDSQLRSMEFFETNLVSDLNVKWALGLLESLDRADVRNGLDLEEASRTVRNAVVVYSAIKNFAAVTVFNRRGDFFSSNFLDHAALTNVADRLDRIPWLAAAYQRSGKRLLLGPYTDPWASDHPKTVFGLVRALPGSLGDLGYIEVQAEGSTLGRVFAVPDDRYLRVAAWTAEGQALYRTAGWGAPQADAYRNPGGPSGDEAFVPNRTTGRTELVLRRSLDSWGAGFVMVVDRDILAGPLWLTNGLTVLMGLVLLALSVAYNWYSSRQLTHPLRLIQARIESTGLATLPHAQPLDHPSDEIVALHDSFEAMKERLDLAVQEEIRTRTLGLQAQMDSLQAQVNPHFLYNILNVVAAKGLEVGSTEVGEICSGIASMLRYSTDTQNRRATLDSELRHVETYLALMKTRLEDRLTYRVEASPELRSLPLPKLVLQPLVENSLTHGFRTVDRTIELSLVARVEGGRWTIEVLDNGEGFETDALARQRACLSDTTEALAQGRWGEGGGLGGLGLRNTVGRLWLYFNGRVTWTLGNRPEGGALVRLEGPIV